MSEENAFFPPKKTDYITGDLNFSWNLLLSVYVNDPSATRRRRSYDYEHEKGIRKC